MPHHQNHRGRHSEDARLFGAAALPALRAAAEEVAWLYDRGYAPRSVIELAGNKHQLDARQRLAIQRTVCSTSQYRRRLARELDPEDVAGKTLLIDAFNLILTVEVALSGGLLLIGLDGAVRDLAGMRGSYHAVLETDDALERIGAALSSLRVAVARFYIDAPISNSGRLRERLLEHAKRWTPRVEVELVPSADPILARGRRVVTADSAILDTCESWLNLAAYVTERVPDAWRLALP